MHLHAQCTSMISMVSKYCAAISFVGRYGKNHCRELFGTGTLHWTNIKDIKVLMWFDVAIRFARYDFVRFCFGNIFFADLMKIDPARSQTCKSNVTSTWNAIRKTRRTLNFIYTPVTQNDKWKMNPLNMYFQLKMVISHCYVNLPVGILYTFPESSYMFGSNPTTLRPYGTSRLKARSLRQRKFMRSRGHVCVCGDIFLQVSGEWTRPSEGH